MATTDNKEVYDLYVFPFSLYSMMTRFTANLGGKSDTAGTGPQIQLKMVNLQKQEQLSEEYLAINPTGQVCDLLQL
jgi:glutathione S-transferase